MNFGKSTYLISLAATFLLAFASIATFGQTIDATIASVQEKLARGDSQSALTELRDARTKNPDDARLKYWTGKIYYAQGAYRAAIAELSVAAPKLASPESDQTVQMLGLSNYILGQLADAIPYLEIVAARQPDNGEVLYALGVCFVQTRQPVKSRETFAKLFGVDAKTAPAFLLNARMHVRQQFEETAEVELKKALELDPKLPEVRFALGELAVYRAEIDRGVDLFKQEIALNPANAMAFYRLGEAYSRQLKWDDALPALQRSIWLNPFFSGPYIVLGKVYLKKKDLASAESLLRRATSIDPSNFGAHHLLAQALQQLGKLDEAKAEFALAERLRTSNDKEP